MDALISDDLATAVVDALTSNICVVDKSGKILAVNRAWAQFSLQNEGSGAEAYLGASYLNICQGASGPASKEAAEFYNGLKDVLDGKSPLFQLEYPCHSSSELRWYYARVTPLTNANSGGPDQVVGAVVSHANITDRKLLELRYAELASTDALTGLPNRRYFEEHARREFERVRRFGGPMALLMLDLDNFKTINDRYGHEAGDVVLRALADGCRTVIRASDLFARIGGEEFVLLLSNTDASGALQLAERLRMKIAGLQVKTSHDVVRVTSSIGVTSVTLRDRTISAALKRADAALYSAKNAGRNRVEVAS